ncbi:MAG: bifunctional hydroxymethylpyrimidine kinase/phosphomethylpyrimidine kinase, partial [Mycobacteriaceae bacterium]
MIPNVLSIAGTDPSGGAGIQADLKTFSALGAYGTTVITALVAQNTHGVHSVHQPPAEFITAQLDNLFEDVHVDAAKVGMLGSAEVVRAVAEGLRRHAP